MQEIKLSGLSVIIILILAGCGQSGSNLSSEEHIDPSVVSNPATALPGSDESAEAVPVFEFEKTRHHFGVIQAGEKVSHSFSFSNAGNAPLVIKTAKAACGCTVPSYTKEPIEPGEKGKIEVTFDSSGKSGMESKNITLVANTVPNTVVLTISAEIINESN